ncbi:MAG: hypothetical protein IH969_05105, partial [Candidatus Krumholzibacteriota bacterium]|nr:hypothetical protein [Candidatus Krumholzibacteriota bacterium]
QDKQFQYTATEFGPHLVRAVASDGTNFTTHDWNLRVTAVPDTIPPAQVVLTRLETGTNPGDVDVEWIAVGQYGMDGIASNYLVRTSPAPVLTEEDWGRSSDRPGVPPPAPAGELMSMTITDIISGRFTYVAVRAVDDFGNLSPLSATAGVNARGMHITGVVRDAESNVPLPDVIVRVANTVSITAADGSFEFFELGPVDGDITVTEDGVVGDIGTHYDFAMPYVIVHEDYVELFLIPNFAMVSSIYTDFYLWFRAMTDTPGIPESTQQRRWELPIDLYVPDYSNGGLDFAKVIKEVAAEFDAYLGRPVFRIVGARPALGVFINYRDDITHDNWLVVEWDPDRYPAVGRIQHRTAYSDSTEEALRKVSRHELGHALGLNHSVDNLHVMVGGSAPQAVAMSLDEIRIMRVRYNLPRGLNVVGFGPE